MLYLRRNINSPSKVFFFQGISELISNARWWLHVLEQKEGHKRICVPVCTNSRTEASQTLRREEWLATTLSVARSSHCTAEWPKHCLLQNCVNQSTLLWWHKTATPAAKSKSLLGMNIRPQTFSYEKYTCCAVGNNMFGLPAQQAGRCARSGSSPWLAAGACFYELLLSAAAVHVCTLVWSVVGKIKIKRNSQ